MENEIKIKRVMNGFVVSYLEEWDDGSKKTIQKVFEDKEPTGDNEENELNALRWALVEIKEQLGYHYSKHNKINLQIELTKNEDNN